MGERDFDFVCRWCGHELILQTETFSNDPSVRAETWWHLPQNGARAGYFIECRDANGEPRLPVHMAAPTRWEDAG